MENWKEKGLKRINELFGTDFTDYNFSITYGSDCEITHTSNGKQVIIYYTSNKDKIFTEVSNIIETVWELESVEEKFKKLFNDSIDEPKFENPIKCWKCGRKLTSANMSNIVYTSNPPKYSCKICDPLFSGSYAECHAFQKDINMDIQ